MPDGFDPTQLKGKAGEDRRKWEAYRGTGGSMGLTQWAQAGRPTSAGRREMDVGELGTPFTKEGLAGAKGEYASETAKWTGAQLPPSEMPTYEAGTTKPFGGALSARTRRITETPEFAERDLMRQTMTEAAAGAPTGGEGGPSPYGEQAVRWDIVRDEDTGALVEVGYDKDGNVVSHDYVGMGRQEGPTEWEREEREREWGWREKESEAERKERLQKGARAFSEEEQRRQEAREAQEWREEQAKAEERMWRERMWAEEERGRRELEVEQQWRTQQVEAQRQVQLSNLRANPASWLEYASLAGETPAVQPWMQPLGQQHGLQTGQALPGFQAGEERMDLLELTRPSSQYMSRLSPSMRQQYGGYEQARTGQTPEDIEFQMWSGAPPSGRHGGLRRLR